MSVANDILSATGGQQGILAGAADIIGAIKGTNVPQNVTYNQAPQSNGGPSIMVVIGAGVLVLILFMVLKK